MENANATRVANKSSENAIAKKDIMERLVKTRKGYEKDRTRRTDKFHSWIWISVSLLSWQLISDSHCQHHRLKIEKEKSPLRKSSLVFEDDKCQVSTPLLPNDHHFLQPHHYRSVVSCTSCASSVPCIMIPEQCSKNVPPFFSMEQRKLTPIIAPILSSIKGNRHSMVSTKKRMNGRGLK